MEKSSIHFDSMAAANQAGKKALKLFLGKIYLSHE